MQLDEDAPHHGHQLVTHAIQYVKVCTYTFKTHRQLMTHGVASAPIMSTTTDQQLTEMDRGTLLGLA